MKQGKVSVYADFRDIDMSEGEWLILARTRYMLNELEEVLYRKGLYYKNKFKKSYEQNLYDAIMNWEQWKKGSVMNPDQMKQIYGLTILVVFFAMSCVPTFDDDGEFAVPEKSGVIRVTRMLYSPRAMEAP